MTASSSRDKASSITNFLIQRSVFFSVLGFLAIFFVATQAYKHSVQKNAEEIADTIARSTFNAMYLVMSQGWNRSQLDSFMQELEEGNHNSDLNLTIYRGNPVTELYGKIEQPGFDNEIIQAMDTGNPLMASAENEVRYLYPLLAERRCQACHTNVEVGDTLGLIEVKQQLSPQVWNAQQVLIAYLAMIAPVPLLFAWLAIRQIRREMSRSVNALREDIQQVATIADLPDFQVHASSLRFSELQTIFAQVQELGEKLRGIAVDRDLLEFEIRLLEKFVITSEVVRDWREYVKDLMVDINQVIQTHTMFSIFKVDNEQFDLEIFWLSEPSAQSKAAMEQAILKRLQQADSPFSLSDIQVRHNISRTGGTQLDLNPQQVELQTKSLLVEAPKIGGIVGVGVQAQIMRDDTRRLVLESILSTLLNVIGSVKAIYKYTNDLEYFATRDPLTNLYNQRMFWELLDYELDRADRHGYNVALMMIDLDNFKAINDSYGHAAGDRLLTLFANTLSEALADGEIICRYGGDEFVVVLPEADLERATEVSAMLMEQIHQLGLPHEDTELRITGSVGVGIYPEHANNRKDLFMFVDNMMYRAKASGKDRVSLPRKEDLVDIFKEMNDKTLLVNDAIEKRALIPVFQPIMATKNGEVRAVEVLSRISLGNGALMSAGEFIEIAESMGKIHLLDYITMDKAFAHAHDVNFQGLLFINLSPRAVVISDFIPEIESMTRKHQIDPSRVVFEITERDSVKNLSVLEQFVRRLKDSGFKLAIDDFGSGFSSFHYLKHFPVDFLKIEGEFIANMATDHRDRAFVDSITRLSQQLKVETVAEFVESEEVLQEVRALGITYAQGYHIGKPTREINHLHRPEQTTDEQPQGSPDTTELV